MAEQYSVEEDKELNSELKKLQGRTKRLILSDYYDHISLNKIQYSVLKQITNAESHNDVNAYLWNTGLMDKILDDISKKLKQARKEDKLTS